MLKIIRKDKQLLAEFKNGYANKVFLTYINQNDILVHFVYSGKNEYVQSQHGLKEMVKSFKGIKYVGQSKQWVIKSNHKTTLYRLVNKLLKNNITVYLKRGSRIHKEHFTFDNWRVKNDV